MSDNCVRLCESMIDSHEFPLSVVKCLCGIFEALSVPEFLEDSFLNISRTNVIRAPPVYRFVNIKKSFLGIVNCVKYLVLNLDKRCCLTSRFFIGCSDTCHQISYVSNLLNSHRMLVLCYWQNPKFAWGIYAS